MNQINKSEFTPGTELTVGSKREMDLLFEMFNDTGSRTKDSVGGGRVVFPFVALVSEQFKSPADSSMEDEDWTDEELEALEALKVATEKLTQSVTSWVHETRSTNEEMKQCMDRTEEMAASLIAEGRSTENPIQSEKIDDSPTAPKPDLLDSPKIEGTSMTQLQIEPNQVTQNSVQIPEGKRDWTLFDLSRSDDKVTMSCTEERSEKADLEKGIEIPKGDEDIQMKGMMAGNSPIVLATPFVHDLTNIHVLINDEGELLSFDPGGTCLGFDSHILLGLLLNSRGDGPTLAKEHISLVAHQVLDKMSPPMESSGDRRGDDLTAIRVEVIDLFQLHFTFDPGIIAKRVETDVATPDKLIDMLKKKVMSLWTAVSLVLDRTNRMLDLGFEPQEGSLSYLEGLEILGLVYDGNSINSRRGSSKNLIGDCIDISIFDPGGGLMLNSLFILMCQLAVLGASDVGLLSTSGAKGLMSDLGIRYKGSGPLRLDFFGPENATELLTVGFKYSMLLVKGLSRSNIRFKVATDCPGLINSLPALLLNMLIMLYHELLVMCKEGATSFVLDPGGDHSRDHLAIAVASEASRVVMSSGNRQEAEELGTCVGVWSSDSRRKEKLNGINSAAQSKAVVEMGFLAGSPMKLLTVIWESYATIGTCGFQGPPAINMEYNLIRQALKFVWIGDAGASSVIFDPGGKGTQLVGERVVFWWVLILKKGVLLLILEDKDHLKKGVL